MEQLLEKLGINWSLLIAQVVNFGIVLFLLTYFLYRPLLDLLDKRRERIKKSMDDAARIEQQMQEFEQLRAEELKKLDRESGEYLERMRRKADELQEQIAAAAKKEADDILAHARRRAEDERRQLFEEVMKTVNVIVLRMTEKILEREFSPEDQKRLLAAMQKELPSILP